MRCPVRQECLADSITETRYTVLGVFGGTAAMTERKRAKGAVMVERGYRAAMREAKRG